MLGVAAQEGAECSVIFTWGRGREGQLGVGLHADSAIPAPVDELRGRHVLQVSCTSDPNLHSLKLCWCIVKWREGCLFEGLIGGWLKSLKYCNLHCTSNASSAAPVVTCAHRHKS